MPEHIHRYKRFKFPKGKLGFRCMLPNCSHYVFEDMIVGKKSICWRCGQEFVIKERSAKLAKPHCGCRQRAADLVLRAFTEQITGKSPNERSEPTNEVIRLSERSIPDGINER